MATEEKKSRRVWDPTYTGDKIPGVTKWIYSIAGGFRDQAYALVAGFILIYIMYSGVLSKDANDYGAQIAVITVFMMVELIWDGLNDPIMGIIVEKCHFKTGKFRPWILIGGIGNTIVILCLFLVRPTGWAYVITFCVFYFLWDTVFTMNDIGYWSMLPSLSSDEKQRNNVTTLMAIFVSIGTFCMYAVCSLIPSAGNYTYIFGIIAIVAASLFLISQVAVYLLCKEHARDPKQDEISSKTRFRDMFTMLGPNKPLRYSVIALFIYYLGSGLVIGFGANYFYLAYGYGGSLGGLIMTLMTVMYIVGTIISQVSFGALSKRFKLQTLLTWSAAVAIVFYLILFLVAFPVFGAHPFCYNDPATSTGLAWAFGGNMWILYLSTAVIYGADGIFYLVLLMMMQNSIEYNEWKVGERKEAVAFSWRPLTVKLSSALQKGIFYLTFLVAGLYGVTQFISSEEQSLGLLINQGVTGSDLSAAQTATATNISDKIGSIASWQLVIVGIGMVILAAACMVGAWLFIHFKYRLDEKQYAAICDELKTRHSADEKQAAEAAGSVIPQ